MPEERGYNQERIIMQVLLNFGHSLSNEVKTQIENEVGEAVNEIIVPCQLDLDIDLSSQVANIEAGPHGIRLRDADMIIVPALSSAAAILMRDHLVGILPTPLVVWLKREGTPPQFVLGGIE